MQIYLQKNKKIHQLSDFLHFAGQVLCDVHFSLSTSAGALPLSSWFYVGWYPMLQKRQRISRCLSYVHSAGLYPALTLSFAAELYSAFYSVYAPLIYVRLYFTSCPVPCLFNSRRYSAELSFP